MCLVVKTEAFKVRFYIHSFRSWAVFNISGTSSIIDFISSSVLVVFRFTPKTPSCIETVPCNSFSCDPLVFYWSPGDVMVRCRGKGSIL